MSDDQVDRRLSAALRAQASGLATGSPARSASPARSESPPGPAPHARQAPPGWAVLAVAVLLGAIAGGLAGVISVW